MPGAGIPVFWGGVKAPQGVGVPSTEEAFLASMDPQYDCWTTTHGGGGAVSTPIYKKEKGRKVRREHTKMMIPLDLVIHMLYSPKSGMVPEYRMLLRVVKVMLGGECIYSRLPLEFLHTFLDQVRPGICPCTPF